MVPHLPNTLYVSLHLLQTQKCVHLLSLQCILIVASCSQSCSSCKWKNAGEGKLRGSAIYNGYDASQAGKDIDEAAKRTKDTINEGTEKSKDLAGSIVEKVKEGTNSAAEALEGAGKKSESDREAAGKAVSDAAKSVEKKAGEVWESTKEGAEKVKDSVVKE